MGSSFGTSIVTTLIARRSQFHESVLTERVANGNPLFKTALNGLTGQLTRAGLGAHEAHRQALARLYANLQSQAATMSYVDTYWILMVAAIVMFLLSFTLKKNNPNPAEKPVLEH
jgi:DHA2 family multidrug resistance protein